MNTCFSPFCLLILASYGAIRASLIAQLVKNLPAMQETPVSVLRWRRDRLPTSVFFGFPCGSAGKESPCNVGDLGLIPGLERSPREGKGYPLQYSGLENSMDCIVHGIAKSQTRLHFLFFFFQLSSLLSWLNPTRSQLILECEKSSKQEKAELDKGMIR